jgi:hypothetical protein
MKQFNQELLLNSNNIIRLNKDEFLSMHRWLRHNNIKWYGGKEYTHNSIIVCFNNLEVIYMDFCLGETKSLLQTKLYDHILIYNQIFLKEEKKDLVVEAVRNDLLERSKLGIKKYNTTLVDNPLSLKEWLQHAYEECLDQANYLKRAIMELEK